VTRRKNKNKTRKKKKPRHPYPFWFHCFSSPNFIVVITAEEIKQVSLRDISSDRSEDQHPSLELKSETGGFHMRGALHGFIGCTLPCAVLRTSCKTTRDQSGYPFGEIPIRS
jgi:hypothetical protein